MKTSKEMQLKIIDKMRENVESGISIMSNIEFYCQGWCLVGGGHILNMNYQEYRIKPETITINGVEIPKPLRDSEILEDVAYYHVDNSELLYNVRDGEFIADHGIRFVYETKQEAITASKALFGLD